MSRHPSLPERYVILVDRDLPAGLATNAAAVLALTIGARFPHLPGADLLHADGATHPGLIPMGLPVLATSATECARVRTTALAADVFVVDFPTLGQQTTDYDAFAHAVHATPGSELSYLGVALCGPAKTVRKLTGGLPLLR